MAPMNYKFYSYTIQAESVPAGDLEGHTVGFMTRGSFYVFESGEVAMVNTIITGDLVKGSGPFMQYATINFEDGSTIIMKSQGSIGVAAQATAGGTSEIIKGTGRFEGIKGTQSAKAKYLPVEKGEAGPKGYGEGMITYTLPPK
jgi:hypothetical protein